MKRMYKIIFKPILLCGSETSIKRKQNNIKIQKEKTLRKIYGRKRSKTSGKNKQIKNCNSYLERKTYKIQYKVKVTMIGASEVLGGPKDSQENSMKRVRWEENKGRFRSRQGRTVMQDIRDKQTNNQKKKTKDKKR